MSWQGYVDNLMADGDCQDSAIVGYTDAKYVWAAHAGRLFTNITVRDTGEMVSDSAGEFHCDFCVLGVIPPTR